MLSKFEPIRLGTENSSEVDRFGYLLFSITCLLGVAWALERWLLGNTGIFLLGLDVAVESITSIIVWRSKLLRERIGYGPARFFSLMFLSFAVADTTWVTCFYVLKLNSRIPHVAIAIAGSYFSGFLCAIFALRSGFDKKLRARFRRRLVFSGLITVPVALRFLIIPFLNSIHGDPWTAFNIGEMVAIFTSPVLLSTALVTIVCSPSVFWSILGCGMTSIVLADWAMRVEKILIPSPQFGIYEYYWAFGIYLMAGTLVLRPNLASRFSLNFRGTLLATYKFWMIFLVFSSIILVSLSSYGSSDLVKFISIGVGFGSLLTVLVSHHLASVFAKFADAVVSTVKDRVALNPDHHQAVLPAELEEALRMVVDERESERQIQARLDEDLRVAQVRAELAEHVIHDIRSPLAALASISSETQRLDEDDRSVVQSATLQLTNIADQLNKMTAGREKVASRRLETITVLLKEIVEQKRFEYRSQSGVQIAVFCEKGAELSCSDIDRTEFGRVLSNLINNSIEAIEEQGMVTVSLRCDGKRISVRIADNGKGIPTELLPELMQRGASFGKPGGSGLGLYSAKKFVEGWGGILKVDSTLNIGTEVTLEWPASKRSLESMDVLSNKQFVLIDNDETVRQSWTNSARKRGISCAVFSSREDFLLGSERFSKDCAFVYVDYRLGSNSCGLEVTRQLVEDGYKNVFLTTGYAPSKVGSHPWLKAIVGKATPWSLQAIRPDDS